MADRKKKRAYLDDFEKDLNGNYQYRGAHYHYKGAKSRGRALAGLWVLCGGGAVLVVAAGLVPGATAYAPFWLLRLTWRACWRQAMRYTCWCG